MGALVQPSGIHYLLQLLFVLLELLPEPLLFLLVVALLFLHLLFLTLTQQGSRKWITLKIHVDFTTTHL